MSGKGSSTKDETVAVARTTETTSTPSKRETRNQNANEWWQSVKNDPSKVTGYLETASNIFGSIFNFVKDAKAQKNQSSMNMSMPTYNEPVSTEPKIMGMNKNTFLIGAGVLGIFTIGTIIYISSRPKQ